MNYSDLTLRCRDCDQDFVFSTGEQDFFQSKGLGHSPSRCPQCRQQRKSEPAGGFQRGFSERAPREMHPVTCAECGVQTTVPFLPRDSRPVYCNDCFSKVRVAR